MVPGLGIGLGLIGFTVISMAVGGVLGYVRGQDRALVRLALIVLSAIIAFFLRNVFVDMVLGMKVGDQTMLDSIKNSITNGGEFPEQIASFIVTIIQMLFSATLYVAVFCTLNGFTWFIFLILKLVVRPDEDDKRQGGGLVVGIAQGMVVAFLFCVPITGFMGQFGKIADSLIDLTVQDEETAELPSNNNVLSVDGNEYAIVFEGEESVPDGMVNFTKGDLKDQIKGITEAPVVKFYNAIGGWYFDLLTSVKDADGNRITADTTTDVLVVMANLANDVVDMQECIEEVINNSENEQEVLDNLGDVLISVGGNINQLDDAGKQMFNDILDGVKELLVPEGADMSPEFKQAIENITVENLELESVGEAFKALSHYVGQVEDENVEVHITEEDAKSIVNALHENQFIMDMVGDSTILEIDKEDRETFKTAISSIEGITEEERKELLKMFAIPTI